MLTGQSKPQEEITIPASGFYPEISLSHFRRAMRIHSNVENEYCIAELEYAIASVSDELIAFESRYIAEGYQTLEAIPIIPGINPEIAGRSSFYLKWREAVYTLAKAALLEVSLNDYDLTRKSGEDRSKRQESAVDDLRARAIKAILSLTRGYPGFSEIV